MPEIKRDEKMVLNIALCDDEKGFLQSEAQLIQNIIEEKDIKYKIERFESSKKLLESETIYDMAFLDIEMPEKSGIELAECILEKNKNCAIFFITNYSVYLDKAFDINALRFFTKPVDKSRLQEGIDRALERIENVKKNISLTNFDNKILVKIPVSSIIYIENMGRKTHVVSTNYDFIAEDIFSTIKNKIEKEVNYFAVPHQSYFVNLHYVTSHDRQEVILSYAGRKYLTHMSRRQFKEFDKKMFLQAKDL